MGEILEEEKDIIDAFNYEMNMNGHKGYCSFTENVDNGYYIYKEGNHWVSVFNEKGKRVSIKRYTNIYNLCLEIILKMNIDSLSFQQRDWQMPKGTEVIITNVTDCPIDEIKKGVIIRSKLEQKEHGKYERIYDVFGDDEKLYSGPYGLKLYGELCFRSLEDYVNDSEKEMRENIDTIEFLSEYNYDLSQNILEVMGMMDTFLDSKGNGDGIPIMDKEREEQRIIAFIKSLLDYTKYKDSYSFDKDSDKNIIIYQENGNWNFEIKYEDGVFFKSYTNIIDMLGDLFKTLDCCLYWSDMIDSTYRYPVNTRVIVDKNNFNLISEFLDNGQIDFTFGTIIDNYPKKDNDGYIIELDSGEIIVATNGINYSIDKNRKDNYSFMTIEQLIKFLSVKVSSREATDMEEDGLDKNITEAFKNILKQAIDLKKELLTSESNKTK